MVSILVCVWDSKLSMNNIKLHPWALFCEATVSRPCLYASFNKFCIKMDWCISPSLVPRPCPKHWKKGPGHICKIPRMCWVSILCYCMCTGEICTTSWVVYFVLVHDTLPVTTSMMLEVAQHYLSEAQSLPTSWIFLRMVDVLSTVGLIHMFRKRHNVPVDTESDISWNWSHPLSLSKR